jgi:hypothetical protein
MISLTYALRGVLLATTGWLFTTEVLSAVTQTRYWTAIFFIASSAASAAYLTVCEIFPLEVRAMAISVFYAIGTLIGGVSAEGQSLEKINKPHALNTQSHRIRRVFFTEGAKTPDRAQENGPAPRPQDCGPHAAEAPRPSPRQSPPYRLHAAESFRRAWRNQPRPGRTSP